MTAGPTEHLDSLQEAVTSLIGQPCLWHVSDDRYGALIDLGPRVELPRPLPNEHLTAEQKRYVGTHSVFINCACELDVPGDHPEIPESTANFGYLDLLAGYRVHSPAGFVTVRSDGSIEVA